MPLDPRAKRLLDMLALGTNPAGAQDAAERRRGFAALMALARPPSPGTEIAEGCLALPHGALAVRCYAPGGTGDAVLPGLVFFHGGGLVAGSLDTHDGLCRMLAEAARCRLVSVDYRLAPEYPFPAAMEDAVAATRAVGRQAARLGIDPARLAVGGDSAGATLAILAATAARDDDGPRLAFQLLLCPVLDLAERRPSRHAFGQGYMLDQTTMDRDLADVLPEGLDPADPRVSPVRAPHVAGLPKTLIHTAEYDPLRDEGQVYAERLATAGVPVEHTCHPGMIHHFVGLTGLIPYAAVALADIGMAMQRAFAET